MNYINRKTVVNKQIADLQTLAKRNFRKPKKKN